MLDVSAALVLFSICRLRPSAVGAAGRNRRQNTAHAVNCAKVSRDMAIILGEKILSGNSHLTGFYADHSERVWSAFLPHAQTLAGHQPDHHP